MLENKDCTIVSAASSSVALFPVSRRHAQLQEPLISRGCVYCVNVVSSGHTGELSYLLTSHEPGYQIVKLGKQEPVNHLLTGGGQLGAVLFTMANSC